MDILTQDYLVDIYATSSNYEFPVENVTDIHPNRLWKSGSVSASTTITMDYLTYFLFVPPLRTIYPCISLFKVRADSVNITIKNRSSGTTVDSFSVICNGTLEDTNIFQTYDDSALSGTGYTVEIEFVTSSNAIHSCGVIQAGTLLPLGKVNDNLKIGFVDTSIKHELVNGSLYYSFRNTKRTFDGTLVSENTSTYSLKKIFDFFRSYGQTPVPIRIYDVASESLALLDQEDYILFGYIDGEPSIKEGSFTKGTSTWDFSITEQI